MTETFSVGEIAIYNRPASRAHGMECIVMRTAQIEDWVDPLMKTNGRGLIYRIHVHGESIIRQAEPFELLKRKPPREDLTVVSWDSVPWWPEALVRNVKEPAHV